jgi:hypothetical protein
MKTLERKKNEAEKKNEKIFSFGQDEWKRILT